MLALLALTIAFAPQHGTAATPFEVDLLSVNYSTAVSAGRYADPFPVGFIVESRSVDSPTPISDSLYHPITGDLEAHAVAGSFEVSAFTAAAGGNITPYYSQSTFASATTEITFSPAGDWTGPIDFNFFGAEQWFFSEGYVSMRDVTADVTLWDYGWGQFWPLPGSTVSWVEQPEPYSDGWRVKASLSLDTDLNSAHTYELTMHTSTGSNPPDVEYIVIGISDFQIVPEPSLFALAGLGVTACLTLRRRQDRTVRHLPNRKRAA